MTPLIRQDVRQRMDGCLSGCRRDTIRRYALALTPAGAGIEAAVTAASVPPLSGGPDNHGSEAAHAFTIADSVGGTGSLMVARPMADGLIRCRARRKWRSGLARRHGRARGPFRRALPAGRGRGRARRHARPPSARSGERLLSMTNFTPCAGAAALARVRPRRRTAEIRGCPRR